MSPRTEPPCRPPTPTLRSKRLKEDVVRFYASEVLLALQYLHVQGYVYRCARCTAWVLAAQPSVCGRWLQNRCCTLQVDAPSNRWPLCLPSKLTPERRCALPLPTPPLAVT